MMGVATADSGAVVAVEGSSPAGYAAAVVGETLV